MSLFLPIFFFHEPLLFITFFLITQREIDKLLEDNSKLERKIRWYAENQELLDRDSAKLKEQNLKIKELENKVRYLESDVSREKKL